MCLNLPQSYDEEFCDVFKSLQKKYPDEIFKLEGLHPDTLDINKSAKEFFKHREDDSTISDRSIDGNSNVSGNSAITFLYEVPKPLLKMNSIYNLWKILRDDYGVETANSILENEVSGDIYINDAWDMGRPYSYHPDTTIIVKDSDGNVFFSTLDGLFQDYENNKVEDKDSEVIDLGQQGLQVYEEGQWVDLQRVLRHKTDKKVFRFETKEGNLFTVTADHPCIMADGSEKVASKVKVGDEIFSHKKGSFFNVIPNPYEIDKNELKNCYEAGVKAALNGGTLPRDWVNWDYQGKLNLLLGILNTTGKFEASTFTMETFSLGFAQQVAELIGCLEYGKISITADDAKYVITIESGKKEEKEKNKVVSKIEVDFKDKYVYDITTSSGKFYSNGHIVHNCFNYSTHDLAQKGIPVSGRLNIVPPKSFTSFLHQVEQFVVFAANMTLGATGLADLLIVSSWYIDRMLETGKDNHIRVARDTSQEILEEDVWTYVKESFAHLIYTVNFEFRGNQSPFTNISIYDKYFLMQLIPSYELNGKTPKMETVQKAQIVFMDVMNEELRRSPITFPVTTACFSVKEVDGQRILQDEAFLRLISEKNLEHAFMNIYSGTTSTLSSCCRLRSSISDLGYTNTFGSGSTKIGSLGVVTINLPRLAKRSLDKGLTFEEFLKEVRKITRTVGRINNSKRKFLKDRAERGSLPLYTLGFMEFDKQYSTTGFTGLYEAMKILGYDMADDEGVERASMTLDAINDENNLMSKEFSAPHNMEQVPAESSSVKLAKKDKLIGIFDDKPEWYVPFYSNQFLPLIKEGVDLIDRIGIQGKLDKKCTGGAVCHLNIDQRIQNVETMINLIKYANEQGVVYFAVNYQLNECEHKHFSVGRNVEKCPECGSKIVNQYTRVVGFLTSKSFWCQERREHDFPNRVFYNRASEELKKSEYKEAV